MVISLIAALMTIMALAPLKVFAAGEATIGGNIWKGEVQADGTPLYHGNTAVSSANVMVQDMESGDFVTYGAVTGNVWTATVPAPGEYVVMLVAPNFDTTSREFTVQPGNNIQKDAYLAQLPLPLANLLVYAFKDDYVNGEDDFPVDPPLNGVHFVLKDEEGNVARDADGNLCEGISGSGPALPATAAAASNDGYYYFTKLKPGKYVITVDVNNPGSMPVSPSGNGWYPTTSIEGGPNWEVDLYPGDPGTAIGLGGYLAWFSYVEKLGQLAPSANAGSISSNLKDGDGNWFADEPFNPNPAFNVTANTYIPKGLVVLSPNAGQGSSAPIATVEADTPSGNFTFNNVPPGNYSMFVTDLPLDYIWSEQQVTVLPDTAVNIPDIFAPRWFSRINGYVTDTATGTPFVGATVHIRKEDGSVWKEAVTDGNGYYNFDELEEIEVLGTVAVEPPAGYRGVLEGDLVVMGGNYNMSARTVQWFGFNYGANLKLERIPSGTGEIKGYVFNDSLEPTTWTGDGVYKTKEDRVFGGVTVELWDSTGTTLVASTASTDVDKASLLAQGWAEPYTWPPDEFGGVFKSNEPGYYEFRGLTPGTSYKVKVIPPSGFSASPAGGGTYDVTVADGTAIVADLGINTLVPIAGEIEGGIFDDINLDTNTLSLLFDEKAPIVGAPVGIYDHMGYLMGSMTMGSQLCYVGSTVCPAGEVIPQKPEVARRAAPGVRIYNGNDPALPGYNPNYEAFAFPYMFEQGQGRFEADWSLLPMAFLNLAGGMAGGGDVVPGNAPVIVNVVVAQAGGNNPIASLKNNRLSSMLAFNGPTNDASPITVNAPDSLVISLADVLLPAGTITGTEQPYNLVINGRNFGDRQGHSTVTLAGSKLVVKRWSDTQIEAVIKHNARDGALVVATSTGISNAMTVTIARGLDRHDEIDSKSSYVDASYAGADSDGSSVRPWPSITEALSHLPIGTHRNIYVAAGTYNERIQITESGVRIIGSGPRETIINGLTPTLILSTGVNGSGPVVYIGRGGMDGGVSDVIISGFTIKGGTTSNGVGGGIFGDYGNSDIDINNCILSHNGGSYGGGVWLHNSNHNVRIWSNIIAMNASTGGYGGGISVNDEPGYGTVVAAAVGAPDHTLDDHTSGHAPGEYHIFNNVIYHNYSPDYGGGISLYEIKDELEIYGNVIMENKSDDHGGGIFFEDSGPTEFYDNAVLRNYAADDGGGMCFEDVGDDNATIKIYNNLIAENIADDRGENTARGAGLSFDDTFYAKIYNNTITGNVVAGLNNPRGGAIDAERNGHEYTNKLPGYSNPQIYNNIIWGNWRLDYDPPAHHRRGEGVFNYTTGINYRWTQDNLHVDNPRLQPDWKSQDNSESFTYVRFNDIQGGYTKGVGNINMAPLFVNPDGLNWRLSTGSPAIDKAPASGAPKTDMDLFRRVPTRSGKIDMGAFEYQNGYNGIVRLPQIPSGITVPRP